MVDIDKLDVEEEKARETPEAEAARADSLDAFSEISATDAEDLLTSVFTSELALVDQDPSRMLSDAQLEQVLSPTDASVTFEGERLLVEGTTPVRTLDDDGEMRKVDLDLVPSEDGFVPANPLTEISLPASSSEAITVGKDGLEVEPVLTEAPTAARSLDGEELFYPETQTDTDLLAAPITGGIELFSQLRSLESPEELRFDLTLPAGAELRPDGEGGAEVIDDGDRIAEVPAPIAVDAQGANVLVDMQVDDTTLVLSVKHRSMDVAYPLLVDPAISESWYGAGNWQSGQNLAALTDGTWVFQSTDWGRFEPNIYSPIKGLVGGAERGLFITAYATKETQWAYKNAQWSYTVPGQTTWITAAGVSPLWRFNNNCSVSSYPQPHDYVGLWSPAWSPQYGWMSFQKDAAVAYKYAIAEPPTDWRKTTAQVFIIGLGTGIYNTAAIPCRRDLYAGGAYVWMNDGEQPQLATTSTSQWMDKAPVRLNVSASDPGLGVKSFSAVSVNASGQEQEWTTVHSCTGLRAKPCPASWNLNDPSQPALVYNPSVLPEGINKLKVTAYDATQKLSTKTHEMTVRVDHAGPNLKLSGTLTEQKTLGASRPQYKLRVDASDGDGANPRSGVTGFTVEVDEKQIDSYQPGCATQSCTAYAEYTLDASKMTPGSHTLSVHAVDALGLKTTSKLDFTIAKDTIAPSLEVSGKLIEESIAGPFSAAFMSASDTGMGVTDLNVRIDEESISETSQPCTMGACSFKTEVAKNLTWLATGSHVAEFEATDGAGNHTVVEKQFVIDSDGPSIELSGELTESEGAELEERFLDLDISANESGKASSGVANVEVEVDDNPVKSWTSTCSPSCPSEDTYWYEYDGDAWPGGHTVYVYARDSLGNVSVKTLEVGFAAMVNAQASCPSPEISPAVSAPVSPEQALTSLGETAPSAVAPNKPAVDEPFELELNPALLPSSPDLSMVGTLPGGQVTEDAVTVSVGNAVCVALNSESASTSAPLLIKEEAVLYANTQQDTDTVARPTATGAVLINQLRSADAPSSITWTVDLLPQQKLVELDSGAIAVTEPLAPEDEDRSGDSNVEVSEASKPEGLSFPEKATDGSRLTDAATQIEVGEWQLGSAQEALDEEIVAIIATPWVRDAAGQEVPAFLTVEEDTFTINVWEPEEAEEDDWSYPFISNTEMMELSALNQPHCKVRARKPWLRYYSLFGNNPYWHLLYAGAMRCSNVQSMKVIVGLQRHKTLLFVKFWDTIEGGYRLRGGSGGLRAGEGSECESTSDHGNFRTQADGLAVHTQNPSCATEPSGTCQFKATDHSATSRYRCGNS